MKRFTVLVILFSLANLFGAAAHAQTGRAQPVIVDSPITIKEAKELPADSWVILVGNIAGQLPGGTNYTLRDATGEIAVEIGPREWRGLTVTATDTVEVHGELKVTRGQYTVKVSVVRRIVRNEE